MNLIQAFEDQAISCERLDSQFMGRVLRILAQIWQPETRLGQVIGSYTGDIGPVGHSLPLRIAGGLHAIVLNGLNSPLANAYPPNEVDTSALTNAISNALTENEAFLLEWVKNPPQTNEVRRSAVLIAGAQVAYSYFSRPFILSELGASGGLNLMWDKFALKVHGSRFGPKAAALTLSPEWKGPPPPNAALSITQRAGVDLNPLNPKISEDIVRLKAYLWADQPHRMALTQSAASVQDTVVDQGDAIDWLTHRLSVQIPGHIHLVQNTIAWQYFPTQAQERGVQLFKEAGAKATTDCPLAWLSMENDGDATGGLGAAITLRMWPGDIVLHLGRADFHGRWVHWSYKV